MTRVIRMMARPALHGSMAMVMVAVVDPDRPGGPDQPRSRIKSLVALDPVGPDLGRGREIADPLPRRPVVVVNRRPPRFVILIARRAPALGSITGDQQSRNGLGASPSTPAIGPDRSLSSRIATRPTRSSQRRAQLA